MFLCAFFLAGGLVFFVFVLWVVCGGGGARRYLPFPGFGLGCFSFSCDLPL